MISIDRACQHLNIYRENVEDLAQVQFYLDAATRQVADFLNVTDFVEATAAPEAIAAGAVVSTPAIENAILILLSQAYEDRSGGDVGTMGIPPAAQAMLGPYRRFNKSWLV